MRNVIAIASAFALCIILFGCASNAASSAASAESGSAQGSSEAVASSAASANTAAASQQAPLPDGVYSVKVETDSTMFHLNEALEGRAELTVSNGAMSVHMPLVSKKIVNLYAGTAEQAQADEAGAIQPTNDKVTFSDGYEKEVYGFDVPVPALDEPFSVAILGEKGKWYDHEVTVSDPQSE